VRHPRLVCLLAGAAILAALLPAGARADEATISVDSQRDGTRADITAFTPASVSAPSFHLLYSTGVNGQVYAQPLIDSGHVYVATEENAVYQIDRQTGAIQWQHSYGAAVPNACEDLQPDVGITSTPVIDTVSHVLYFVARSWDGSTTTSIQWNMHALDLTQAPPVERPNFPVIVQGAASNDPAAHFDPVQELQRPGLLLLNGRVFAGFGSFCDEDPYRGWVAGVSGSTGALSLFSTEANTTTVPAFADAVLSNSRTVNDAVLTAGSTTMTSSAGAFSLADADSVVSGAGIPGGTVISTVTSPTNVVLSAAATATSGAATVTVNTPMLESASAPFVAADAGMTVSGSNVQDDTAIATVPNTTRAMLNRTVTAGSDPDVTVDNRRGAVWQSGGGLASDGTSIFMATGNGSFPAPGPGTAPSDRLGQSVVRLAVNGDGSLTAADRFTPCDAANLSGPDLDIGSGSPALLPDGFGGVSGHSHLLTTSGKGGRIYVLDRDSLGGFQQGPAGTCGTNDPKPDTPGAFHGPTDAAVAENNGTDWVFGHPAAFRSSAGSALYYTGWAGPTPLRRYTLSSAAALSRAGVTCFTNTNPCGSQVNFDFGSSSPVISWNGTDPSTAVLWVVRREAASIPAPSLMAFTAVPSGTGAQAPLVLLRSLTAPGWTSAAKFNPPVVDGGLVFVGTADGQLLAFGSQRTPATTLARYISGSRHWVTAGPVDGGFIGGSPGIEEGPLGSLATTAFDGALPLFGCLSGTVHFLSRDSRCEGATVLRSEGFSATSPAAPFDLQIYRCRVAATNDHFVSAGRTCEGQVPEGSLGFVARHVLLQRTYSAAVPDHWSVAGGTGPGYGVELGLGWVAADPEAGTQPIFGCTVGSDRFTSLSSSCEGQHVIGRLGYVWSALPAGGGGLYRCLAAGDHFDSSGQTCEGQHEEARIGYTAAA
jgi:hypothetical protein